MERFRDAFRRLEKRLKEASRSTRFKPPSDLAIARVHLKSTLSSDGLLGEVLDLSLDGMKIAIEAGQDIEVGEHCHVAVGDGEGETYALAGTVRWIEDSSYITVFGLSLDSADRIEE
nr:PilZ domain-containing protein [Synechococcus sp. CCY 9618]